MSARWLGGATVSVVGAAIFSLANLAACVGDDPSVAAPGEESVDAATESPPPSGKTEDGGVPPVAPDASPPLGCPLGCLPPAPKGWIGPSATYDGPADAKPAGCPDTYIQSEVEAHQGLKVGPTTCACGVGANAGAKCSAVVTRFSNVDCTGTPAMTETITVPSATCASRTLDAMRIAPPTLNRGTCTFAAPKVSGPAPTFDKASIACGLPQLAACADRAECVATPVPAQPFTRLCIHKDGDESCPSLDYVARFVAYKSTTDDRTCTCAGAPAGGACGNVVTNFKGSTCGGALPIDTTPGGCFTGGVASSRVSSLAPTGVTCPGGAISGSAGAVADAEPVTFCCNK